MTKLDYVDTVYSACSVEFCPDQPALLACGTYQIAPDEEATSNDPSSPATKRLGRCLIYDTSEGRLREIQRFDGPAILDMKWTRYNGQSVLGIANAKGAVSLHGLTESQTLEETKVIKCSEPSNLCLSLDWSNRRDKNTPAELAVSISDGSVAIFTGEDLTQTDSWHAHDFEPWIVAWDCWNTNTLWTGGDDCYLKAWDRRQGFVSPLLSNKRFDGGVTTIQSHALRENLLAVGSYDSRLRVFDKRKLKTPLVELDVGGGIWRAKWHASDADKILLACMHDGFKIVSMDTSNENPDTAQVVQRFEEHTSLAYGADWAIESSHSATKVASCSFYDHLLSLWNDAIA